MGRITFELLQKRSEHNSGMVRTMKEVTLHQFELEKIELLGQYCRQLEILYLQNNLIPKIENLNRLKQLKYINLALNNITSIEGLEENECLEKLDLTVNFLDVELFESSMEHLGNHVPSLRELYLTGNPVFYLDGYRSFVIYKVPQLHRLDGTEITRTERLLARQNFSEISGRFKKLAAEKKAQTVEHKPEGENKPVVWDPKAVSEHTPAARVQMYKELEEEKRKSKEELEAARKFEMPPDVVKEVRKKMGEKAFEEEDGTLPRQRNLNRLKYKIGDDDEGNIVCRIECNRYLCTSLIEADIHPRWFQILMKEKSILLHLDNEVKPSEAEVRRVLSTGWLEVIMPLLHWKKPSKARRKEPRKVEAVINSEQEDEEEKLEYKPKAVDLHILKPKPEALTERNTTRFDVEEEFEDDSDVPPLE